MLVKLAYAGRSDVKPAPAGGQTVSLSPNLAREAVSFDAALRNPLRFREAISALHDVVVADFRFKPRDKDKRAYIAWKKSQQERESAIRREALTVATEQIEARRGQPLPPGFEKQFHAARKKYWDARIAYSRYLQRHDYETWRLLVPCDPVITIADDVVFFECFSGDESSYGCLTAVRDDTFGRSDSTRLGATNVDYSWDLYHHFQRLRTYRETRFRVDPAGFEVATAQHADYREEKIDLPQGWLKGFVQLQSAMTLPGMTVRLARETVYSLLAWIKRHKARTSPRAIRFELSPGRPPRIILEPWEISITDPGNYDGPPTAPVRVWGARRLLQLARALPLAERFDVHLLGTGLPHFWVARMGELRLMLGLSGWTVNDWTRSAALDLLAPPAAPSDDLIARVAAILAERRSATLAQLRDLATADAALVESAARHLAHSGQLIFDLTDRVYRWRQILPQALGEAQIGPPHEELLGLYTILQRRRVQIESSAEAPRGARIVTAKVDGTPCEVLIDADGRITRGKCLCGWYRRFGMKNGPCRHMMAARIMTWERKEDAKA
jgi:hypothetical protein